MRRILRRFGRPRRQIDEPAGRLALPDAHPYGTFKSRVLWPDKLVDTDTFELRAEGLLGRIKLTNKQYLHPRVMVYLVGSGS